MRTSPITMDLKPPHSFFLYMHQFPLFSSLLSPLLFWLVPFPCFLFKMTLLSSHLSNPCLTFVFLALFQSHTTFSALILSLRNHRSYPQHPRPMFQTNRTTCALFAGTWVRDDTYPLYQYSNCPVIDAEFSCQMSGRPDSGYLKYRWQPLNCQLPRYQINFFFFLVKIPHPVLVDLFYIL